MNNKTEYRYQWSSKADNGEIVVVRADTKEELVLDIEWAKSGFNIKTLLESQPEREETITREPVKLIEDVPKDWCAIHDVKMFPKEGQYGKFYSHSEGEYPNIKYCNGKGFK